MKRMKRKTHSQPTPRAWRTLLCAWGVVLVSAFVLYSLWQAKTTSAAEAIAPEPTATVQPSQTIATDAPKTGVEVSIQCTTSCFSLRRDKPTILIYHTHTTEAYTQTAASPYVESGEWRTADNTKNVVAVGEALKTCLEETYGFCVIHDTTDHEPPKLSTAYTRSEQTMQRYHDAYPSIVLYIDLHRDAYDTTNAPTDFITINGVEMARLMFVVGEGTKYDEKPYFESNLALAQSITTYLSSIDEKLVRPIRMKSGRYNQHVSSHCLLVEVGHNANTLEQAIASMPYLAEGIAYAFAKLSDSAPCLTPD